MGIGPNAGSSWTASLSASISDAKKATSFRLGWGFVPASFAGFSRMRFQRMAAWRSCRRERMIA